MKYPYAVPHYWSNTSREHNLFTAIMQADVNHKYKKNWR